MKARSITLFVCTVMWFSASLCTADWFPGMSNKWVQHPDLTTNGMDVSASVTLEPPVLVADDFRCDATGPITNIHIWGSWFNDVVPEGNPSNVNFVLSIHADIPAEQSPSGYSMPGDVLWAQRFDPSMFTVRSEQERVSEWWYNPALREIIPEADQICWQYNFMIMDPPFVQAGTLQVPLVYWLAVQAEPSVPGAQFGWKTSVDHWNDAAAYAVGTAPYTNGWTVLTYPPPHPGAQTQEPLDLACVIVASNPPPAVEIDVFPESAAVADLVHPTGSSEPLHLMGPSAMHVFFEGPNEGDARDDDRNGTDEVQTEIVSLSLSGSSSLGPVQMHVWPMQPAVGQMEEGVNDTSGLLDVAPFGSGSGFHMDSFFDVFVEIEIEGNDPLVSGGPTRMSAVHTHKPPAQDESYTNETGTLVPLLDAAGEPTGFSLRIREFTPNPDPAPDGVLRLCPKWIQPPDCDYGLDLPSYAQWDPTGQGITNTYRVADDWICDGRPIDGIRWWGSYPGWLRSVPPEDEQSGRPMGFRLTWYTDVPEDAPENRMGYSMPGEVLTNVFVPLASFGQIQVDTGTVTETYFCAVTNKEDLPVEHEYEYRVELHEPWNEKAGRIYWLSVEAIYVPDYVPGAEGDGPEWGWKTSTTMNIIDDAVVWPEADIGSGAPIWFEMIWPDYPWPFLFWSPNDSYTIFTDPANEGPSLNMAFELLTEVCPRRATKWSQMPDMITGTDMWSWRYEDDQPIGSPYLRADDFISDGRRITDIHWWGSYSNWMYWVDGSEGSPVLPPSTNFYQKPLGFNLSWHDEDPAGGCVPGPEITNIFVRIEDCHEMYYGVVTQLWVNPEPPYYFEHEYQYYVDLLDVAEPWYEKEGGHYWLNIEAVFPPLFRPIEEPNLHGGWGWKISERVTSPCFSVEKPRPDGPWQEAILPRDHINPDEPFDLAFELTTDEVGLESEIIITNIAMVTVGPASIVNSLGTSGAGTQYLEACTNLLNTNWVTVLTNPFPPPITNVWLHAGTVPVSNRFYRVIEK
ncbi:MAG: hypothetical protein ISS35_02815 [Kiritimatiellae bacterium]|nr:hypothetical protein [Kiritimatiellia bacterium]